ncbi:hypothetical protein ACFOEE_13305 [Pseudoalteromonas fenneropenaei]|uniref:Uncharacterized protein n=1 Tax=Pseudoalteromonas fenneropenaei TaxID=1737459 RepID=A0ABV7CLK2_9GAMM
MELAENSHLQLPLFKLDGNLASRPPEQPDLELSTPLDANLLALLCQNPSSEESVSIPLERFSLQALGEDYKSLDVSLAVAELVLNHGPVLNAVVSFDDELLFVSPPLEMMPTFDLDFEVDEQ